MPGPGWGTVVAGTGVAGLGVLALAPVAARVLGARGVLDVPNARSSHSRPTIRGAGLVTGPVMAVALALGRDRTTVTLAVLVLAATVLGGFEDLRGVPVGVRAAVQTALGVGFLAATWSVGHSLNWFTAAVAFLFVVGYVNAFNFMDGINGISAASAGAAGVAFIAFAHLGDVPDLRLVGAVLVAAALCFLPFNFPAARMFLGDSGSYSFGLLVAGGAVTAWRGDLGFDAVLAPLAIYMADTSTVIIRRALRRESISAPHREHVYQRLVQLGASHARSTGAVLAFTVVATLFGLAGVHAGLARRLACDAGILLTVAAYLALPRIVAQARRSAADETA